MDPSTLQQAVERALRCLFVIAESEPCLGRRERQPAAVSGRRRRRRLREQPSGHPRRLLASTSHSPAGALQG